MHCLHMIIDDLLKKLPKFGELNFGNAKVQLCLHGKPAIEMKQQSAELKWVLQNEHIRLLLNALINYGFIQRLVQFGVESL